MEVTDNEEKAELYNLIMKNLYHYVPVELEDDASSTHMMIEDKDHSPCRSWSFSEFFSFLHCCGCSTKKQTKKKFK